MHAVYWLITKVFNRPPVVSMPLGYPDPEVDFYGYVNRILRLLDGSQVPITRNLIRVMGWAATALLAYQAGQFVSNKKDCASLYRQYMRDGWAAFQEELYHSCRLRWNYQVPVSEVDRESLRRLCRQALGYENHFLSIYKRFVLQELRSKVPEQIGQALWVLDQIPYDDPEINLAVMTVGDTVAPFHP